ncbi:MAG: F0F1 ATP synthase subunit delta [Nitrosomonadales bacterium]|nr:F0F1 ATP synthase subunit delta [Nitrosomonadales bacterium]
MEFDWTTFALEIINFLVLVWLLQRFLYKPVTAAIARRQAGIEKTLADAREMRGEAEALKRQYENRMAEWEQEKARAFQQLRQEMDAERARLMAALQASLDEERNKQHAVEQRRAIEQRQRLEEEARTGGGRFAARLLSRLASAELEERIRRVLLEDLPQLPERELHALRSAGQTDGAKITSAYPLSDAQRAELTGALDHLAGRPVACEFGQSPDLMAGLRISVGPWMLRSSLLDELHFFAGAQHADAKH